MAYRLDPATYIARPGWKHIMNDHFVLSIIAHPFCFRPPGKYNSPKGHRRFRECEGKSPNAPKECILLQIIQIIHMTNQI